MNPSLVQELLEDQPPPLRILYGVATGANTVLVAGSTVAVVLPALSPVVDGDYVAVLATGADRLILGRVGGGAWTSWTPVVTQGVNVTVTNTRSRLTRDGGIIHVSGFVTVTGAGTAGNTITVSLPVAAASGLVVPIGVGNLGDNSFGNHPFVANIDTTTTMQLQSTAESTGGTLPLLGSAVFTAGLAVNDTIKFVATYEAAS